MVDHMIGTWEDKKGKKNFQIRNKVKEGRFFGNALKRKEGRFFGNGGSKIVNQIPITGQTTKKKCK